MSDLDQLEARIRTSAIKIHTPEDYEGMRRAGRLGAECLDMLTPYVVAGAVTDELDRLARDFGAAVWPFDPPGALTLAEVYPSLLAPAVAASGDSIPDRAQVRLLARALFNLSCHDRLSGLFTTPAIAAEEGWILGAGHARLLGEALSWT